MSCTSCLSNVSCTSCLSNDNIQTPDRPSKCSMYHATFSQGHMTPPFSSRSPPLEGGGPSTLRTAMHLYIMHDLYFEIYIMLLEVIQLMSIAGYEAYVCVCFFVYKTLCAAFIWLLWDARSCSYVFILRENCFYTFNFITTNYWNKNEKNFFLNEQKVWMLLQKRTDTRGVGISSMRKSIYLLTTTPTSHTHRFHPLPLATPTSCSPHPYIPSTLHNCHPYFELCTS